MTSTLGCFYHPDLDVDKKQKWIWSLCTLLSYLFSDGLEAAARAASIPNSRREQTVCWMGCLWSQWLIEESHSAQKRPVLVVKKENSNWVVPQSSGCNRSGTSTTSQLLGSLWWWLWSLFPSSEFTTPVFQGIHAHRYSNLSINGLFQDAGAHFLREWKEKREDKFSLENGGVTLQKFLKVCFLGTFIF